MVVPEAWVWEPLNEGIINGKEQYFKYSVRSTLGRVGITLNQSFEAAFESPDSNIGIINKGNSVVCINPGIPIINVVGISMNDVLWVEGKIRILYEGKAIIMKEGEEGDVKSFYVPVEASSLIVKPYTFVVLMGSYIEMCRECLGILETTLTPKDMMKGIVFDMIASEFIWPGFRGNIAIEIYNGTSKLVIEKGQPIAEGYVYRVRGL